MVEIGKFRSDNLGVLEGLVASIPPPIGGRGPFEEFSYLKVWLKICKPLLGCSHPVSHANTKRTLPCGTKFGVSSAVWC